MFEENGKRFIQEKDLVQDEWYKKAKDVELGQVDAFIYQLLNDYSHDSDTIVHAMVAGCLATISAMNGHREGDIGQSQSHKLLGQFIRKWALLDGPAKLWSWAGLLNTHNEAQIMVIQPDVAQWLKVQAEGMLKSGKYADDQRDHLIKITEGCFPWGFRLGPS